MKSNKSTVCSGLTMPTIGRMIEEGRTSLFSQYPILLSLSITSWTVPTASLDFLAENQQLLTDYLAFKQSTAYKCSPAYKIQLLLQKFNSSSGYNDVFIPAMKRLSPSYAEYYRQMEIANEKLLAQYPNLAEQSRQEINS